LLVVKVTSYFAWSNQACCTVCRYC